MFTIPEKTASYRRQLLDAGMQEPANGMFFRQTTPLTAFVVNLHSTDDYIELTYGYASTAFTLMANNSGTLSAYGISDDEITLREKVIICTDEDEQAARRQIQCFHDQYLHTQKDQLLACAKEKRRAFIAQITGRLKPLGFKKTANTWKKPLDAVYYLIFHLQKSSYADTYYFNVYIGNNPTDYYAHCFNRRLGSTEQHPLDWQVLTPEEAAFFLDRQIMPTIQRIVDTPLEELGKLPFLWEGCLCNHRKCPTCWVEKNIWEAK